MIAQFNRRAGLRVVVSAAVVALILLSTAGSPVSARPPPHAVCGVCSDTLIDAADENGVTIGLAASSLAIRIDRSGTGHWTARVTLTGSGVETLRENQSLRNRVVQQVHERGYVAVEEPASLTTAMESDTLIVKYEVPEMAHESAGGVYVVDFFYWHGGEARWFYLAADSMTMRGPPGTVVSHAPADAVADGEVVTWEGSDQEYDPFGVRSHIVFAPDDGIISSMATTLGVGVDIAQLKAQDLVAAVAPIAILAAILAFLWRVGFRLAGLSRRQLFALVGGPLAAIGLTAATIETLVDVSGPMTEQLGDFLFYLIFVVVATGAGPVLILGGPLVVGQILLTNHLLERGTDPPGSMKAVTRLLVWPSATILAGQWLLLPAAAAGAAGYDTTYGLVSLVLPALYFVPLAVTRQWRSRFWILFTIGLLLSPLPVVFAFSPHTGMNLVSVSLVARYVPWALVIAAIGILAYATSSRLIATERDHIG